MKRPAKPKIKKPNLVWKWNKSKEAWQPFHRTTWIESGTQRQKTILLRWEGDPELLDKLYWECRSGMHKAQQPPPPQYTWRNLVIEWRKDPRVQSKLAESTKVSYRREMDAILEKNADKDIRHTKRQQLRKAHEKMAATPRKADKFLGTIGMLWNYGKLKLDWPLGDNPSEGIDRFGKQKEFEPWPEWMLNKLQSADTVVQQAAFLILNTGQRPNAAITMQWSQFTNGEMSLTDEKGDVIFDVHCPEPLQKFLSNTPKKGRYIIAKNLTEGLGYNAIEKRFRTWRAKLGPEAKKFSLHGLRKLAIIHLAEAGATDAQIQSITNQSSETIAYYRRLASRKKLSKAAFNKRDNNT